MNEAHRTDEGKGGQASHEPVESQAPRKTGAGRESLVWIRALASAWEDDHHRGPSPKASPGDEAQ